MDFEFRMDSSNNVKYIDKVSKAWVSYWRRGILGDSNKNNQSIHVLHFKNDGQYGLYKYKKELCYSLVHDTLRIVSFRSDIGDVQSIEGISLTITYAPYKSIKDVNSIIDKGSVMGRFITQVIN